MPIRVVMASSASTKRPPAKKQTRKENWQSRAVIRDVEAGSSVDCAHCGERVKFQAKMRNRQVICNVYVKGSWSHIEHYHADCYEIADHPHGDIVGPLDARRSPSPAQMLAAQSKAS